MCTSLPADLSDAYLYDCGHVRTKDADECECAVDAICAHCDGSGEGRSTRKCLACHGTGVESAGSNAEPYGSHEAARVEFQFGADR